MSLRNDIQFKLAPEIQEFLIDALVESGRVIDRNESPTVKQIIRDVSFRGPADTPEEIIIQYGYDKTKDGGFPWILTGREPNEEGSAIAFSPIIEWVRTHFLDHLNPYAVAISIAQKGYEGSDPFGEVHIAMIPRITAYLTQNAQQYVTQIINPLKDFPGVQIQ